MDNRRMAEEIVRLVGACHGHALVLFTAYRQMAEVRALTDGQWQYPTYQAWRNGGRVIQQFKESGNGVSCMYPLMQQPLLQYLSQSEYSYLTDSNWDTTLTGLKSTL